MVGRDAWLLAAVDIGLAHPAPDRLLAVAKLSGNASHGPVVGAELCSQLADETDGLLLLCRGVSPRRRPPGDLLLWHDSIILSKVRSLQQTQGGLFHHGHLHGEVSGRFRHSRCHRHDLRRHLRANAGRRVWLSRSGGDLQRRSSCTDLRCAHLPAREPVHGQGPCGGRHRRHRRVRLPRGAHNAERRDRGRGQRHSSESDGRELPHRLAGRRAQAPCVLSQLRRRRQRTQSAHSRAWRRWEDRRLQRRRHRGAAC